jgi:hypothetical protein
VSLAIIVSVALVPVSVVLVPVSVVLVPVSVTVVDGLSSLPQPRNEIDAKRMSARIAALSHVFAAALSRERERPVTPWSIRDQFHDEILDQSMMNNRSLALPA